MFGKVAKWLGGVAVIVFAVLGVVVVVVVVYMAVWLKGMADQPAKVVELPAVVIGQQGVDVCSCGSGVQCTGSRGGKFCVDESGNKRYK